MNVCIFAAFDVLCSCATLGYYSIGWTFSYSQCWGRL